MSDTSRHHQNAAPGVAARLALTRKATGASIALERFWPLILPAVVVVAVFVTLSWFGVFRFLPDMVRIGLGAVLAIGFLASLLALRRFRRPRAIEIDRRIETANALLHAPVSTQTDRLSGATDSFSQALWREHQKRMAEKLGRLASDLPRTGVPERDPFGARAAVALLLVTAFAFSFGPLGGSLTDVFVARAGPAVLPARIDAWVTPPAYTGKPPIFLTADANREQTRFAVPEGSDVALRVTGGTGAETLDYVEASGNIRAFAPAGEPEQAQATPAANPGAVVRQFAGKLGVDGALSLKSGETELKNWSFAVTQDEPPAIRFAGEPKRAVNGTLELAYEVEDDYGPASASAAFAQAEPRDAGARPLYEAPDMPLSLPRRDGRANAAKTSRDLTEHAWAGTLATVDLTVVDAAGQEGKSETKTIRLPERPFTNPLAKAIIEQRRMLALDANAKPEILRLIDAMTIRPEDTIDNKSHYLGVMTGRTKLVVARSDEDLRAVVDYFWELALGIEDGDLSAAEKRLRQAQEALRQALENGASDEEIEKLMAELREAMQDFLREFAERAQQNPNSAQQTPPNGQEMRQSDLDRMLDQIEELAKSGARDKAQELLSQLQDMMNNLQAGRQQQQGQQGQQSEMRQQMDKLGEIMRRQQEMMNETFRMDQMQRGQRGEQGQQGQQGEQGQQGQQGQQPGQGQPMTPEEFAEALKQLQQGQGQLQGELGDLMKSLEGMGIQPGEGFGEAQGSMGEAEQSLGKGEGGNAVGEQGEALEALRRGAQDMMQQMQQAQQGDQGGGEEGGRQQNADRDPLGRPRATTGPDFGDTVEVPDEIDVQRAREILDAIRRRLGNALSPALERDYLERLLEMR